jgi:hypothetical protein
VADAKAQTAKVEKAMSKKEAEQTKRRSRAATPRQAIMFLLEVSNCKFLTWFMVLATSNSYWSMKLMMQQRGSAKFFPCDVC